LCGYGSEGGREGRSEGGREKKTNGTTRVNIFREGDRAGGMKGGRKKGMRDAGHTKGRSITHLTTNRSTISCPTTWRATAR